MQSEPNQLILFFILVTLLVLCLSGFILAILFKYQQKHTAYLSTLEKVRTEHETLLLKSQLEIQEATLKNVSKEIHDNIGLSLTLAKLNLTKDPALNLKDNISTAINLVTDAINNLRTLSRTLNSDFVLEHGLCKSLEKEVDYVHKTTNLNVNLQIIGDPLFLSASKELIMFRIVQEALNNAVKHSKPSKITVELKYLPDQIKMNIADDGIGFEYGCNPKVYSGINNMWQRAHSLKGECIINSKLGQGTTIILTIPLKSDFDEI